MSFIKKIKASVNVRMQDKPFISLSKLIKKHNYPIFKSRRITNKFGESILLELEDCSVFLPKRCNSQLDDDDVQKLTECCLEVVKPYGESSVEIDFHLKVQDSEEQKEQAETKTSGRGKHITYIIL